MKTNTSTQTEENMVKLRFRLTLMAFGQVDESNIH